MSNTRTSTTRTHTPLAWMESAFQNVCGGPRGLRLDLDVVLDPCLSGADRRLGALGLVELRQFLLDDATAYPLISAVWAELVRRAQPPTPTPAPAPAPTGAVGKPASTTTAGEAGNWQAWQVGCVGMVLPALKRMYRRLAADRTPGDVEADMQAALVAGLLSRLRRIDPDTPRLPSPLLWSAWRSGSQVARDARAWAQEARVGLGEVIGSTAPPAPAGHPDLVLAHAVTGGLLTSAEAGLISETRVGGRSLVEVAAQLGATANAVGLRRRKAEARLVTAIRDGSLTRHGYWPPPPSSTEPAAPASSAELNLPAAARHVDRVGGDPHSGDQRGSGGRSAGRDGKQDGLLAEDGGKHPARGVDGGGELGGKGPTADCGVPQCRFAAQHKASSGSGPVGAGRGDPPRALTPPAPHHRREGGPPTAAVRPAGPDPADRSVQEVTAMRPPRPIRRFARPPRPDIPATPPRRRACLRRAWPARPVLVVAAALVVVLVTATAALADPAGGQVVAAPASLAEVIARLRLLIVGLLVALATLYATIGGVRYLSSGGDPAQIAKAKDAIKHAAWGYALAALAPLLVSVLQQLVA